MTLRPEPYRHLANDAVFRALTAFSAAARSRDVEMSALALAWVLHHPQMNAAIVGPRRPAQLDAALLALAITLSPQERADLTGIFAPAL
jgi:aryl-alcohol dehydrogenase-like predicted oxidoreductase